MLGRTNTGGGGSGGLNFKVVGGTTAPSNPKENMIWINTSTKITDWVFSATQPSAKSGRVWISTGTSSSVEFNALKKNGIQVYPLSAKQYVSGAWVDKEVEIYQNGKWDESMKKLYFYNRGDLGKSGGFTVSVPDNVIFDADHIKLTGKGSVDVYFLSKSAVPLQYKTMVIVGEVVSVAYNNCFNPCGLTNQTGATFSLEWSHNVIGTFTKEFDISNVNIVDSRYVRVGVAQSMNCIGKIYEIYFTR